MWLPGSEERPADFPERNRLFIFGEKSSFNWNASQDHVLQDIVVWHRAAGGEGSLPLSRANSEERPGGFGLCPGQLQTSPKRIFTLAVQIFLFLHLMLDFLSSQLVLAAPGFFSHP